MDKEKLLKGLDLVAQTLSEEYDVLHFNPDAIHAENNVMGIVCKIEMGFHSSVRGIELVKLLKKMPGKEVEFTVTDKTLNVKSGTLSAKLRRFDDRASKPRDFSELIFEEVPEKFSSALAVCSPSVSDKEIQGILTGLHLDGDKATSCNNITAMEYTMEGKFRKPFTIPKTIVNVLSSFEPKYVCIEDARVIFTNEDKSIFIYSVLMAGKYPFDNVVKLLGASGDSFSLPEGLGNEAYIVSLYSFTTQDKTPFIEIDIQKGQVVLTGDKEFGSLEDTIVHESKGETKFHVDPSLLIRALGINKEFTHCGNYIVFKDKDIRYLVCLVNRS